MRNLADALFPKTRQQILAATMLQPERWWYLSDLAKHLKVTPSTLQRELSSLTDAGILVRKEEGRQVYFRPEPNCPILPEIQRLMIKTVGVVDTLRNALVLIKKDIELAFVYGSFAKGEEITTSDVDLMVIGPVGLSKLAPGLRKVEELLGREVNPTVYSKKEFAKKVSEGNHFLSTVVGEPKLFIIGDDAKLFEITGSK